jgi:rhodanese-related sulfurtransferase
MPTNYSFPYRTIFVSRQKLAFQIYFAFDSLYTPSKGDIFMRLFRFLCAVLLVVSMWHSPAVAAEKGKDPFKVVTSEELKALIDNSTPGLVVIDARSSEEYQEVHIKNALSIPLSKLEKDATLLPTSKNAWLVFYCNGIKCGKSGKSAKIALDNGYRDVSVYADGMPVWEEKGYSIYAGPDYDKTVKTSMIKPVVVKALLDSAPATLTVVDVRDAKEFAEGHVPGAINIPVETFASGSGVLDKNKQIVVYCNSGGRSYNAYRKLQKLAYPNIVQMIFADWQAEKLPVEK